MSFLRYQFSLVVVLGVFFGSYFPVHAVEVFRDSFETQAIDLTEPPPVGLRWNSPLPFTDVRSRAELGGTNVLYGASNSGVFSASALPDSNWDLLDSATISVNSFATSTASLLAERRITGWSSNRSHLAEDGELTAANGALFAVRWRDGNYRVTDDPDYGGGRLEYFNGADWIAMDDVDFGPAQRVVDSLRVEVDFLNDSFDVYARRGPDLASLGTEVQILNDGPLLGSGDRLVNVTLNRKTSLTGQLWTMFDDVVINTVANTHYPDGDVNLDGVVDVEHDFQLILSNFFAEVDSRMSGDLTGDGRVNLEDFLTWRSNAPPEAVAAVSWIPEPHGSATFGLLVVVAMGIMGRRRKRDLTTVSAPLVLAILGVTWGGHTSPAQTTATWTAELGDWDDDDNWSTGAAPSSFLNEVASIRNGGVVQVSRSPIGPGRITVGPGTVDILEGGYLPAFVSQFLPGTLTVGSGGIVNVAAGGRLELDGTTRVEREGVLNVDGILKVGTPESVGPTDFELQRAGIVNINPDADVDVTGTIDIISASSLVVAAGAQVDAAGFSQSDDSRLLMTIDTNTSPLKIQNSTVLAGEVNLTFAGAPLSPGDRVDLIDTSSASFRNARLTTDGLEVGPGQIFELVTSPGGTYGNLVQASLSTRLVLDVNRSNGAAQIRNVNALPIDIHSYSIESSVGSLTSSGWNTLDNQQLDGNSWAAIGTPSSHGLAELNAQSHHLFGDGAEVPIGSIYRPAYSQFGQKPDDLVFRYSTTDGELIDGFVTYEGDQKENNFVLTIDPATGEAVMQNESPLSASITSYSISSASGALRTAEWTKLASQGVAGWVATSTLPTLLTEQYFTGNTPVNSQEGYPLGAIFSVSGDRDLGFEINVVGLGLIPGIVQYGVLPNLDGILGDLNGDGSVDAADAGQMFGVWGTSDAAADLNDDSFVDAADAGILFGAWTGDSDASSQVSVVPEPSTWYAWACVLVLLRASLLSKSCGRQIVWKPSRASGRAVVARTS